MQTFAYTALSFLLSCSINHSGPDSNSCLSKNIIDSVKYSSSNYIFYVYYCDNELKGFKFISIHDLDTIQGLAQLIKVDGIVPEGTNCMDYNNPKDSSGFECDSTYMFNNGLCDISFTIEKYTRKRLELIVQDKCNLNNRNILTTLVKE
jgi:hypothetical protein